MIGLTDDHRDHAAALADCARTTGTAAITKDSETLGPKSFEPVWAGLAGLGVAGIAVPERFGGAGGTLLDLAVAVEACAAAMVPGPVLPTAVAGVVLEDETLLREIAAGAASVALGTGATTISLADGRATGECSLV